VTYPPPLGPPGHIVGYHLPGTLVPIGAIASAASNPPTPAVAPPSVTTTPAPVRDERFDGQWTLFSAEPYLPELFAYHVTGGMGICTKTNAPGVFDIGDVIFQIAEVWGDRFHALQMFTDGRWYRCSGVLAGDEKRLEGNYWRWVMIRTDAGNS
jgi:hypothetical protein